MRKRKSYIRIDMGWGSGAWFLFWKVKKNYITMILYETLCLMFLIVLYKEEKPIKIPSTLILLLLYILLW